MTRSALPTLLLALGGLAIAGCEGRAPWAPGDGATDAERPDLGPTAAYDRRVVFLGPGDALPTVAIFDFAALSDSLRIRRGVRARLVDGTDWVPLLDEGWELEPMRDPWRLVPHESLRLVVGDAGELDALVVDGEPRVRLESGATIAEYSPDAATQFMLRQGFLSFDAREVSGIVFDAQFGRTVPPTARPAARGPGAGAAREADASGEADAADEPAVDGDTGVAGAARDGPAAGGDPVMTPTPAPRAGAEAVLVDNAGFYAVFGRAEAGELAWIRSGSRDDVRRGARLEPAEWEAFGDAGVQVPVAWRIAAPVEGLTGELRAESADRARLGENGPVAALGYVVVTGWIEDRGARRDVYGIVRSIR